MLLIEALAARMQRRPDAKLGFQEICLGVIAATLLIWSGVWLYSQYRTSNLAEEARKRSLETYIRDLETEAAQMKADLELREAMRKARNAEFERKTKGLNGE